MTPESYPQYGPVAGLDAPFQGGPEPDINAAKFHKPLMKLAQQKLKLKKPVTHRKKRHHRVDYY